MTGTPPTGEPVVRDVPERMRYEIRVGDELGGFVQYHRQGGVIDLVHTEIEPAFEGQGLGGRLAAATLDDLRRRGLAVVPTCPFIRGYIERHPDYADLVVADDPVGD